MNAEQEQIRSANKPIAPSATQSQLLGQSYALRRPSVASTTSSYGNNGIGNGGASAGYSAVKKDFPVMKVPSDDDDGDSSDVDQSTWTRAHSVSPTNRNNTHNDNGGNNGAGGWNMVQNMVSK